EWIDIFDSESGERVDRIDLPSPLGASLLEWEKAPKPFDVEGNTFAVSLSDGEIYVLDIASGEHTRVRTTSTVNGIALSPNTDQLAVGSVDRTVRVFDLKTGSQIWETVTYTATNFEEIPFPPGVVWFPELQPSFLPAFTADVLSAGTTDVEWVSGPSDRSLVVAIGGSEVHSFDARSGERVNRAVPLLDLNDGTVAGGARYVDLLHDGTILVRAWGLLYRFDPELEQIGMQDDFAMGRADQSGVAAANIVSIPHEPIMALATDGLIKFGTAKEPAEGRSGILTGTSGPRYMAVGPDGGVAAIASSEGIRLVALDGRSLVTSSAPRRGAGLVSQTYDASEAFVYSLFGGVSRAIDLTGSRPRDTELPNIPPNAPIQGAPVPADVDMIYLDSAVSFINRETGADLGVSSLQWFGDSWSNDGTRFFSPQDPDLVEGEPTFLVFDLRSGETVDSGVLTDFVGQESNSDRVLYASAWSVDDSQLILTFTDGLAVRFDTESWGVIDTWEPDPAHSGGILEVAYSPDGRYLASRDGNASLDIRDPDSLEILFSIETGGGAVEELGYGPIWSKDSRYLLTVKDGNPRLWNVEERALAGAFPNDPGFLARGFASADYPQLVTVRDDNLQFWNTDPGGWYDIACEAAGRNLTQTEWEQFGPTDAEYEPTCPQWPSG
ncbi:MAG: PQQ-binding-like beta-propeller repeat protein, partial [Acidimicrobiales bacterium]|nr:PQQ-binding-like beta-propeller repeat protein [Acidimicrobiales bacterium]